MEQTFKISDIRRAQVGEDVFAAVVLQPIAANVPQAGYVAPENLQVPSPFRVSGLSVADVQGWEVGDTITVTFTLAGA